MGWTFQSGTQLGKNVLNSRCSAQNVSKGIFAGGDTSLGKGSTSYWVPAKRMVPTTLQLAGNAPVLKNIHQVGEREFSLTR